MSWLSKLLALGVVGLGMTLLGASPAAAECRYHLGIGTEAVYCFNSGGELTDYVNTSEGSLFAYRLAQLCTDEGDGSTCDNPRFCVNSVGVEGTLYTVLRRPLASPSTEWETFAVVCLTAGEESGFEVITWRRVFEVMKSLEWPQAELVVQPVGGRTLVNFETNFFSTTTAPRVQVVRLVGRRVEIRATPVSYTWHWGDGSGSLKTDDAGAAHVDGEPHRVFHVYTEGGVGVRPSVDVTYAGEYRVEGEVEWLPIHETLTVTGDPVALEVVRARVHLVG